MTYDPGQSHPSHLDENELALFAEFLRHEREELPAGLREHVEACPHCRAEVMDVADMIDWISQEENHLSHHASRVTHYVSRMSRFKPVIRIAASLAAVVFLALIIQRIRTDKLGTDIVSGPDSPGFQKTVTKPADTLLLAQAYVPDSTLEALVHATYRTAHNPHPQGPSNNSVFRTGDTLTIAWTPEVGGKYSLITLNNRQEEQSEINLGQGTSLHWKIELKPGLYYWKFLAKDELWHVGKFMVLESSH